MKCSASESKAFLVDLGAELFMFLIQFIRSGSWKVRRLNQLGTPLIQTPNISCTEPNTNTMQFVRAQNCTFFPSLLPFPTVIAFNRAKKSPLIIGIVYRIKINFCKQLFQFSESELSHAFCKLHVLTYFMSVSFISAAIAQINLHWQEDEEAAEKRATIKE